MRAVSTMKIICADPRQLNEEVRQGRMDKVMSCASERLDSFIVIQDELKGRICVKHRLGTVGGDLPLLLQILGLQFAPKTSSK